MKKPQLKKFSHKIALVFAASSTILIIVSIYSVLALVNYFIDNNVKQTLRSSIEQVTTDFQANELGSKNVSFLRNRVIEPKSYDKEVKNVADVKSQLNQAPAKSKDKAVELEENELQVLDESLSDSQLSSLQQNNQVYARVFLANGQILFSSDLFDTYSFVDPEQLGFRKLENDDVCLYVDTVRLTSGDQAGAIIQTGQYCSFTKKQQKRLWFYGLTAALLLTAIGYLVARKISGWIISPLFKLYQKTLRFSRQVYHELLTPVTVALSTAESATKIKQYKSGLVSVTQDLQQVQACLKILSDQINGQQSQVASVKINLLELLKQVWAGQTRQFKRPDLKIDWTIKARPVIKAKKSAVRLILRNLVSNIFRHAGQDAQVKIKLTKQQLTLINSVSFSDVAGEASETDIASKIGAVNNQAIHGVGLSVVKDLAQSLGWVITSRSTKNRVEICVRFGDI